MTDTRGPSEPGPKLLGTLRSKVRIALASAAILTVGLLAAPERRPTPLAPPQERAAPRIEADVQTRSPGRALPGTVELAARLRASTVTIIASTQSQPTLVDDLRGAVPEPSSVSGSGVIMSPSEVLTHIDALDGRPVVTLGFADGRVAEASVTALDPETGLTLLDVASTGSAPPMASDTPVAGSAAAAIGGAVAAPIFVVRADPVRVDVSGLPARDAAGIGLFTLAGELFGIAETEGAGLVGLVAALARLRGSAAAKRGAIGLALQELTPPLAAATGMDAGALIAAVVPEGPAAEAGLAAGDVLVSMAGRTIDRISDAQSILRSLAIDVPMAFTFMRGDRPRTVSVTPRTMFEVASLHRTASAIPPEGPEAITTFAAEVLAAAAVPPQSRVLAINGRAIVTPSDVRRRTGAARPALVWLSHEGRTFFAAIRPSTP